MENDFQIHTKYGKLDFFRYVFTIAELDTVAPAYDYFEEKLKGLCDKENGLSYSYESTEFPQYFCYEKSKEMIIIKIIMD